MKKNIILLITFLCIFPNLVFAKSNYVEIGDDLVLEENKSNSYVVFGEDVDVKNTVDGVYAIFGNEVKYNAYNDYILMFSDSLDVSGTVKDGIFFGNTIELNNINISRDIIIFGNDIKLNGNFGGNIIVFGSSIDVLNSKITGNLITYSNVLNIDKDTTVNGKLQCNEDTIRNIESDNIGSVVVKDVKDGVTTRKKIIEYIYDLIKLLVIFLAMIGIMPYFFDKFDNNVGKNFLYGIISFLSLPIILLIFLFTNFASSAAIIGILLYVIFIMISKIVAGYIIGDLLWDRFIKSPKQKYLCGIFGITLVYILSIIPIVGNLATFVSLIYSFGIIINMIINRMKK